jgi:hypothetical protein
MRFLRKILRRVDPGRLPGPIGLTPWLDACPADFGELLNHHALWIMTSQLTWYFLYTKNIAGFLTLLLGEPLAVREAI